jgi:hypothetical protein
MEHSRTSGRPFERACRLPQNPRALQCSYKYSENIKLVWVETKEPLQVAPRRKKSLYDAVPYPGDLGFEWTCVIATWEDRLSELADYRKSTGTAMFLAKAAKTPSWLVGFKAKTNYRLHREGKKSTMTTSPFSIEKTGFWM